MEATGKSMQGKVCLITGATSGIGLVAARELVRRGARVVIVGRDPARCTAAVAHLHEGAADAQVDTLLGDLSSQEQVRQLAAEFLQRHPRLDVLINNAGGLWMDRRLTADALEMTFAVNHLAYFLLTNLLLDRLKACAPSRVVNVASAAHRGVTLPFDDLTGHQGYNGWRTYKQSKFANILFTYELARRLAGTAVTANALHPGWVATGFGKDNGWKGRLLQAAAGLFALSPEAGARTVVYLASSPEVAGVSGRYFVREKAVASSAASYDESAARRLWEVSEQLTGLAAPSAGQRA
jgi:NAD(P)-dependent dehydrogenase (short-subunit alcohol dehydrogenase family)